MREVEELEMRIRSLTKKDFSELRDWFYEFENNFWDQQISADFKAGKFNKLIEKARTEFAQGKAREL